MSATVVCISASDAAEAEGVATAVGEALGFRVINEEIVARAAAAAGVDEQAIEDVEHRKTALGKIADLLALWGASTPEFFLSSDQQLLDGIPVMPPHSPGSTRQGPELRELIRSAVEEFAAAGEVVILAHAASQSLAARGQVLRVLVTASPTTRSARLADTLQLSAKEADSRIKHGDAGRADYLKRFYGIAQELPTHYDLVVNTDVLSVAGAAAAIVGAARAGAEQPAQ